MYRRILLTLDRSPLAEQALPHAVALAQAFKAGLDVVVVIALRQATEGAAGATVAEWESELSENKDYLAGILSRLQDEDLKARVEVLRGDVAEESPSLQRRGGH